MLIRAARVSFRFKKILNLAFIRRSMLILYQKSTYSVERCCTTSIRISETEELVRRVSKHASNELYVQKFSHKLHCFAGG